MERWQLVFTGAIALKVALFVTVLRKAPRSDKTLFGEHTETVVFIIFEFTSDEIDENVL